MNFHNKFIKFWIISFFQLSSYCRIYSLIYFHIYICVCVYIYIYIFHIKEKPLKITQIFSNDIYFSRPYIFKKMLDLNLQQKKHTFCLGLLNGE